VSLKEKFVGLDIGTSSVRALLVDGDFNTVPEIGLQKKYEFTTRTDGSVEVEPGKIIELVIGCLDELHAGMQAKGLQTAAVGISTFWHCFLGVDKDGKPTSPIVHLFDTRSGSQMEQLTDMLEAGWIHAITGCVPHTSYWPTKLLWFKENRRECFDRTVRWMSVGEYVLFVLTGQPAESTSMVSASGIWDQRRNDYCEELLSVIGVDRDSLAPVETLDQPRTKLQSNFAERWPLFDGIPWYPAYGDGACNSIGSGCTTPQQFALMVGTSGAMRVVVKTPSVAAPAGIWCYRVNRERFILGGAISNGGEVFRWTTNTLKLPPEAEDEVATRTPGSHGLTMLPYFAGERSPYWRPDLRAAIAGISLATKPVDILQACLESVSLRFRQIYLLLTKRFGMPEQIVTSGGALLNSKIWQQMMADALGHSVIESKVSEASIRGAAIITAELMGLIEDLEDAPVQLGKTITPKEEHVSAYEQMFKRDMHLFDALYGAFSVFDPPENQSPLGHTTAPFVTA
jgi:gluconokinase